MAPTLVLAPAHDGADPVAFKVKYESNFAKGDMEFGDRAWFQRQQSEPAPMKRQHANKSGTRVPSIAEKLTSSVEQDEEDLDMDFDLLRQQSEPAPMKRQLSSKARVPPIPEKLATPAEQDEDDLDMDFNLLRQQSEPAPMKRFWLGVPPIPEKLATPAEQEEEDLDTDFGLDDRAWFRRQESEPAPVRQFSKKSSHRVPSIAERFSCPNEQENFATEGSTAIEHGIEPFQVDEPEMEPSASRIRGDSFCFEPEDFEQPDEHGRQISTFSATSGGFCRQETEQYWPMHSSLGVTTESGVEVNAAPDESTSVKVMHPLFVVPATQMVWPTMPNPSFAGTHRKGIKNSPTMSMHKDRRSNPRTSKSLITQAWEAQQRKKQEQQQQEQAKAKLLFRQLVTGVCPPPKEDTRKQGVPRFCFACGNACQPHFKFCPYCRTQLVST